MMLPFYAEMTVKISTNFLSFRLSFSCGNELCAIRRGGAGFLDPVACVRS